MTKKDYIKFATMLKIQIEQTDDPVALYAINSIVQNISDIFKEDNPRFDANKFDQAVYK